MNARRWWICVPLLVALALAGTTMCHASPYNYFTLVDASGDDKIGSFNISNNSGEGLISYYLNGAWHNLAVGQMATFNLIPNGSLLDIRYFLNGTWYQLWDAVTTVTINANATAIVVDWNVGDPNLTHAGFVIIANNDRISPHLGNTSGVPGNPVPIPPSAILLGSGLLGLVAIGIKRRKRT